ncbi:hypothetical protein CAOG_01999 [Capsaspora owczarzaki ATCC 30864]|nr:hypothetical protein CAOG_01999 [Capsaspora owczarzaki ATCC 30864]|eukprot:XP_004364867.2 hypothetical protein CAOG_01999 [Capsaspora owczarzaki ATCC 30864]
MHHWIGLEINQRTVHCNACHAFIAVTDRLPELFELCESLSAIATQRVSEPVVGGLSRRATVLALSSDESLLDLNPSNDDEDEDSDRRFTAEKHYAFWLMSRTFLPWRALVDKSRSDGPFFPPSDNSVPASLRTPSKPPSAHDQDYSWIATPLMTPIGTPVHSPLRAMKRRAVAPGQSGLRNLGNTCFMNVILQSLSHAPIFRDCILALYPSMRRNSQGDSGHGPLRRVDTTECYTIMSTRISERKSKQEAEVGAVDPTTILQALHSLMRIMWSGKWAVVTPHAMLRAVWASMPAFHGYEQQDCQEFYFSIVSALENSLKALQLERAFIRSASIPAVRPVDIVSRLFLGKFRNETICHKCHNRTWRSDDFLDVGLDFPNTSPAKVTRSASFREPVAIPASPLMTRVAGGAEQRIPPSTPILADPVLSFAPLALRRNSSLALGRAPPMSPAVALLQRDASAPPTPTRSLSPLVPNNRPATPTVEAIQGPRLSMKRRHEETKHHSLIDLIEHFTCSHLLDGQSYDCENCRKATATNARGASAVPSLQYASLKTRFEELPVILVFHVKRFRWLSWQACEKITLPLSFPAELDMSPFVYTSDGHPEPPGSHLYSLFSVVEHLGKGIIAGHYTNYCYDFESASWQLFNDHRVISATFAEVQAAQPYMLFYLRKGSASYLLSNSWKRPAAHTGVSSGALTTPAMAFSTQSSSSSSPQRPAPSASTDVFTPPLARRKRVGNLEL